MKNAEIPAMPTSFEIADLGFVGVSNVADAIKFNSGLTKREMFAMHMSGHILASLNYGAANGEWSYPSFEELANQAVQYADALLKELEE